MGIVGSKEKHASELEKLTAQVKSSPYLITEGIKNRIEMVEDAVIIHYKDLMDANTLKDNIQSLFGQSPKHVVKFLVEVATNMYSSLNETEEMTEVQRQYCRKTLVPHDNKLYGMEVFYVVRGVESSGESRDRVQLMIAYRLIVSTMEGNIEDYPPESERQGLPF